jgi:hypothetical protein
MSNDNKGNYVCKRCGYDTELKTNLKRHLERRTVCEETYSTIPCNELLAELNVSIKVNKTNPNKAKKEHIYHCDTCDASYAHKSGLSRHMKTCRGVEDTSELILIVKNLQNRVRQLEDEKEDANNMTITMQHHINHLTQINNFTQNVHIHLNNFGNEDVSHITTAMIEDCIKNPSRGFVRLIKDIHFNADMPSNHNLKHKSTKQNTIEKYIDGNWVPCDASNTLDELIRKNYKIINCYYIEKYENDQSIQDDPIKQRIYEKHRFLHDKNCNEYYAVKRELRVLIKDQTMFLLEAPDTNNMIA